MPQSKPVRTSATSSLKRRKVADATLVDDTIVAQQPGHGVAAHQPSTTWQPAIGADLGDLEDLANLGLPLVDLLEGRLEQSDHRLAQLVAELVDDRVQANLDLFLVGQLGGVALGANVEADDDGVGRRGQQHVVGGDRTDAGADDVDLDLIGRELARVSVSTSTEPWTSALRTTESSLTSPCWMRSKSCSSEVGEAVAQLALALLVWRNSTMPRASDSSSTTWNDVAGLGKAVESGHLDRRRRSAWSIRLPRSSVITRTRPQTAPETKTSPALQRAVLHQNGRDVALAGLLAGLQDDALSRLVGTRLELQQSRR